MINLPAHLMSALEDFVVQVRNEAFEEAATIAILTGNHLSILPPSVRKFPQAGGIIAAKILELRDEVKAHACGNNVDDSP